MTFLAISSVLSVAAPPAAPPWYCTALRRTLQFGGPPAGFGGCDGGGAGGVHQRSPQHAGPALLGRRRVALAPGLEVVLALACTPRNLITGFCWAEEL